MAFKWGIIDNDNTFCLQYEDQPSSAYEDYYYDDYYDAAIPNFSALKGETPSNQIQPKTPEYRSIPSQVRKMMKKYFLLVHTVPKKSKKPKKNSPESDFRILSLWHPTESP